MFTTLLKKEVRIVFVIALLTSTLLVTYFTPKVSASPTPTIFISPSSGHVGDSVRVIGAIDTANGAYNIFFDEEKVANGTASLQKTVNATFFVPHRYKGNYTVKIYDVSADTNSTSADFFVDTNYYINAIMPQKQTQLMEGQSTTIRVNVTGGEESEPFLANVTVRPSYPVSTTYYNSSLRLVNTTRLGEYVANCTYPKDFGSNAHTNYTGTYTIALNTTLAVGYFNVGLTNATQYPRLSTVAIQAANYTKPNERAWINITSAGKTVFYRNVTAIGGVVKANWTEPEYGAYNVTVASSTSSKTIKPIRDTQIFAIGFQFQIQIKNLDNEDVRGVGVTAAAYNRTDRRLVADVTSDTGFARLWLEPYAYYFRVSLKGVDGVQVGSIKAINVTGNVNQTLVVQLANIKLSVTDETGKPLRFIAIDLKYNYTKIGGGTSPETRTLETDTEGSAFFKNTFANISYLIEAKRYGSIFNRTTIGNLTASQWINITCPTYPLVVNLVDSEGHPLPNISVNITEWSSELLMGNKTWTTNDRGSVPLNLTFGRYKVKAYDYSAELDRLVVLNETVIDLLPQKGENKLFRTIYCRIVNLSPSPSILVIDYFGQPIPNAEVKVERFSEIEQKWVEITLSQRFTGSDGVALLPHIGGDYSISISVLGQLSSIKSFYIDETSVLVFKIDRYTTIGGFVLETSQLIVYIALGLLIISLGIVLTYKKILQKIMKK